MKTKKLLSIFLFLFVLNVVFSTNFIWVNQKFYQKNQTTQKWQETQKIYSFNNQNIVKITVPKEKLNNFNFTIKDLNNNTLDFCFWFKKSNVCIKGIEGHKVLWDEIYLANFSGCSGGEINIRRGFLISGSYEYVFEVGGPITLRYNSRLEFYNVRCNKVVYNLDGYVGVRSINLGNLSQLYIIDNCLCCVTPSLLIYLNKEYDCTYYYVKIKRYKIETLNDYQNITLVVFKNNSNYFYIDTNSNITFDGKEYNIDINSISTATKDYSVKPTKNYLEWSVISYPSLPFYTKNGTLLFNFEFDTDLNLNNLTKIVSINSKEYNQTTFDLSTFVEGNYSVDYAKIKAVIDGFVLEDVFNISSWFVVDRTKPNISIILSKPNEGFYTQKQKYSVNVSVQEPNLDYCYFDSNKFNTTSFNYSDYVKFGNHKHTIICRDKAGNEEMKTIEFEGYQSEINLLNEFQNEPINCSNFDYIKINAIDNQGLTKHSINLKQNQLTKVYYVTYNPITLFELFVQQFGASYVRKGEFKSNVSLYLVDMLQHTLNKITWKLISLTSTNNIKVFIKKQLSDKQIVVDSFNLDVSNPVDSYLVQNERYLIEYIDNDKVRIWGTLQPSQNSEQIIVLDKTTTKEFQTIDKLNFSIIYNGTFFKFHYLDNLNGTELFVLKIKIGNKTYTFSETNKSDVLINLNVENKSFVWLDIYIKHKKLGELKLQKLITNEQSSANKLSKYVLFFLFAVAGVTSAIAVPIASIVIASTLSIFVLFRIIDVNPALLLIVWLFVILIIAKRGDVR